MGSNLKCIKAGMSCGVIERIDGFQLINL